MPNKIVETVKQDKLDARGSKPIEGLLFACRADKCRSSFNTQNHLNQHVNKCHKYVRCSVCGKKLKQKSYDKHANNTKNENCKGGNEVRCDKSGKMITEEEEKRYLCQLEGLNYKDASVPGDNTYNTDDDLGGGCVGDIPFEGTEVSVEETDSESISSDALSEAGSRTSISSVKSSTPGVTNLGGLAGIGLSVTGLTGTGLTGSELVGSGLLTGTGSVGLSRPSTPLSNKHAARNESCSFPELKSETEPASIKSHSIQLRSIGLSHPPTHKQIIQPQSPAPDNMEIAHPPSLKEVSQAQSPTPAPDNTELPGLSVAQEMKGSGDLDDTDGDMTEDLCASCSDTVNLNHPLLSLLIRKFDDGSLFNSLLSVPVSESQNDGTSKRSRTVYEFNVNRDLMAVWKLRTTDYDGIIDSISEQDFDHSSTKLILNYIHTGRVVSLEQLIVIIDGGPCLTVNEYIVVLFMLECIKSFSTAEITTVKEHAAGLNDTFLKDIVICASEYNGNWDKTVNKLLFLVQDEVMRKRLEGGFISLPILDDKGSTGNSFFYHWLFVTFSKREDSSAIKLVLECLRGMVDFDIHVDINSGDEGSYRIRLHSLVLQFYLKDNMKVNREYLEMLQKSLLHLVFPKSTCREFYKLLLGSSVIKDVPDKTALQLLELCYLFHFDNPMKFVFGSIRPDTPANFRIYWEAYNKTNDESILNIILGNAKEYVTSENVIMIRTLALFELLRMTNLHLGTEMAIYDLVMKYCEALPVADEDVQYKTPKCRFEKLQYVIRFPQFSKDDYLLVLKNNQYMTMSLKCLFFTAVNVEGQITADDIPLEFKDAFIKRKPFGGDQNDGGVN